MKARNFRYVRPASLQEAYRTLAEAGGEAVPIAGGQSLLAGLNMRLSSPKVLVDIGNLAELTGQSYADGIVRLGAHLLGADEEELNWDGGRAILPRDLNPGESAEIEFVFRAPEQPGDYIIEFDMVAEHVTWFEDFGAGVLRHRFSVD